MSFSPTQYDACIIGAGVVGCAIARELSQSGRSVVVIDNNPKPGQGTTSRNSEVIHSGIYYPEGSLKAGLCVAGRHEIYKLAEQYKLGHKKTGKLIVAQSTEEELLLEDLRQRGEKNGVAGLQMLTSSETNDLEPAVCAKSALLSSESGIISAHELCDLFFYQARDSGCDFAFNTSLVALNFNKSDWQITTDQVIATSKRKSNNTQVENFPAETVCGPAATLKGEPFQIRAQFVINSAGLFADWVAQLAGIDLAAVGYQLHWVKGEYFALSSSWGRRVSRPIYPIPERNLLGLGIHLTIDLAGQLRLGPNAIPIAREMDYTVNESHVGKFCDAAKRYLPNLQEADLTPFMSGIRPRPSRPNEPARDFIIQEESARGLPGLINLLGIESPGLTAAPAIARYVREIVVGLG